jgi:hypothetical protein
MKALEPDEFTSGFYQQNWATVGEEVCMVVLSFLNYGIFYEKIIATNIALIPKVKKPTHVSEFRPISLCNVIYKLISKVLVNKLKLVLPHVIFVNQSAFIPNRIISDNILTAYETLYSMQTKLWGNVGYMGIKLDISNLL